MEFFTNHFLEFEPNIDRIGRDDRRIDADALDVSLEIRDLNCKINNKIIETFFFSLLKRKLKLNVALRVQRRECTPVPWPFGFYKLF